MFVEVNFQRKNNEFGGAVYTYNCTIPHIKTGDFVLAPTQRGDTPAKIVGIGIPYEEINPRFRDNLRTISERYVPDAPAEEGDDPISIFDGGR